MKSVLISGGNSGLGLEIAKLLLGKGYQVIILGKDKIKLEKVQKDLNTERLICLECDLRDFKNVEEKVSKVKSLDILINCAGIINYKKLEDQDPENIIDIINTNLLGTIFLTRKVLPIFKKQNSGIVLNISSTSGLMTGGHPYESVYIASKFGVTGFNEALRKELTEEGKSIKVLGLYPGGMNTKLFSKAGLEKDTSNFLNPKDIAEIGVFMLERPGSVNMDQVVVNRNKAG